MLSHLLLGPCVALSQHGTPLRAGGHPAGPVEDQAEEEEEDGDKRVAADGHQRGRGQPRLALFGFHDDASGAAYLDLRLPP